MKLKKVNKTYHVCFKTDDGTPMEVDTGCADYGEAKAVAGESKAAELEKVAKVMRLTSDIVSRIVTGKEMTMNLALGRYKVWAMNNLTGRTAGSHISYVTKWIKDFNLEKVTPAAIEDNMVSGWVNSQGKGDENLKASTRRVRKAALSSFLDYCYNKGWMLTKPAELCRVQMDKLTHQQKETKSHEAMNDEDIKALMKEADAFWQMAIHLASVTGLRLGDVCALEWACFDGNTVTVWTDKRDKRISVRVPTAVINSICDLPVSDPTYLFPDRREVYRDVNRRAGLSVQFKRLCNRAAEKSGRNGLKKKSFHGLRSYYAKTKLAKGVKVETIAKDLGHSSTKTTDVYLNTNQ
jgi:integrase